MLRIVFVCRANMCRSPLAESIAHKYIKTYALADRIAATSAGIEEDHIDNFPDYRAIQVAKDHGLTLRNKSRLLTNDDLQSDLIFAMDRIDYPVIEDMIKMTHSKAQLQLIREYDEKRDTLDLRNPIQGNQQDFIITYDILDRSIKAFFLLLKSS
jgi:protein-tyrosine phosphatase